MFSIIMQIQIHPIRDLYKIKLLNFKSMKFQRSNYIQSGIYTIRYSKNLFQDCFMNIYRSNVLNETE